ncbi:MAG: hypothetical protein DRP82_04040 [Planctomycetota bacterium]|nr:MAG: hypothetical protein DRP82_04040 [Planctomycetota bacterium]
MRWLLLSATFICGIVLSQQGGDVVLTKEERAGVVKFYRAKMRWSEEMSAAGHPDSALKVVEALLLLGPPTRQLEKELLALRKRLRREWMRSRLIDAYLAPQKRVFTEGDKIVVRLVLASRSDKEVVLLQNRPGEKEKVAAINVFRRCFLEDGTVRVEEVHGMAVTKSRQVTLREGQAWVRELLFDTPEFPRNVLAAYKYLVAGTVNIQLMSGKERVGRLLPLDGVEFMVLPKEAKRYADKPFKWLVEGLKAAAKGEEWGREALFYGGMLVGGEKRADAVAALISWLPRLPRQSALTATAVLSHITNKPFGPDIDAWLNWWKGAK